MQRVHSVVGTWGGSAQHFYEEGIRHGNCEDPEMKSMDGEGLTDSRM